jgi:peptidoglycan hydrolase-like protein with peptidoglycan-binding domain
MRPDVCGASRSARPQGIDTEDMDGLIGPKTINAVRAFELNKSLRPDGYASFGLLKKLCQSKRPCAYIL